MGKSVVNERMTSLRSFRSVRIARPVKQKREVVEGLDSLRQKTLYASQFIHIVPGRNHA